MDAYRFGAFSLDAGRLVLTHRGRIVPLAPKVVHTLVLLIEHGGEVTTKAELMERLWPDGFVEEGNLTQNIYVLRRTLRALGVPAAIETIAKRGYRFTIPVQPEPAALAPATVSATRRRVRAMPLYAAAAALLLVLGLASEAPRARASAPLSAQSAQAYRLGRYYWSLRTVPALHRSIAYFQDVVRHDPRNGAGYAGLADAYVGLYDYACDERPCPRVAAEASAFARTAARLDPGSAAAQTSLAMTLRVFAHDYARSDAAFARAIALDPAYAPAHQWFGNSLLVRGRTREALRELEHAVALEPVAPATYGWLARAAYYDHRYAQAVEFAREALALEPRRMESREVLGLALAAEGRSGEALRTFASMRAFGASPGAVRALQAGVYARTGRHRLARATITAADDPGEIALAFVALHDYPRALASIRKVRFADDMHRTFFALDPRLDPIRSDARFRAWDQGIQQRG